MWRTAKRKKWTHARLLTENTYRQKMDMKQYEVCKKDWEKCMRSAGLRTKTIQAHQILESTRKLFFVEKGLFYCNHCRRYLEASKTWLVSSPLTTHRTAFIPTRPTPRSHLAPCRALYEVVWSCMKTIENESVEDLPALPARTYMEVSASFYCSYGTTHCRTVFKKSVLIYSWAPLSRALKGNDE